MKTEIMNLTIPMAGLRLFDINELFVISSTGLDAMGIAVHEEAAVSVSLKLRMKTVNGIEPSQCVTLTSRTWSELEAEIDKGMAAMLSAYTAKLAKDFKAGYKR